MTRPAPVVLVADREYSVVMNLGAIDSIERETGLSAIEVNSEFVASKPVGERGGRGKKLRVGLVYRFVVGAIASVDPTFPARANEALNPSAIYDMITLLAPAWNEAVIGIYGGGEEPEKKEPAQETPSTAPASSSESPPTSPG